MALFKGKKPAGEPGEWFYCVKHATVEEGPQCPSRQRLGPYATRQEAERAIERVSDRNEAWDSEE